MSQRFGKWFVVASISILFITFQNFSKPSASLNEDFIQAEKLDSSHSYKLVFLLFLSQAILTFFIKAQSIGLNRPNEKKSIVVYQVRHVYCAIHTTQPQIPYCWTRIDQYGRFHLDPELPKFTKSQYIPVAMPVLTLGHHERDLALVIKENRMEELAAFKKLRVQLQFEDNFFPKAHVDKALARLNCSPTQEKSKRECNIIIDEDGKITVARL